MFDFTRLFGRRKTDQEQVSVHLLFQTFRELLDYNNQALELMADMGEKLSGDYLFDKHYIESTVARLEEVVYRFIYDLNLMTQKQYLLLFDAFEKAKSEIRCEFEPQLWAATGEYVYPLSTVSREMSDLVGEKMSTLGELRSHLGLQIPDGFVISTYAFRKFIEYNRLEKWLIPLMQGELDRQDTQRNAEELHRRILQAGIPVEIRRAVRKVLQSLKGVSHSRWAVRSSAVGEDSEISYAGQYETVLNVSISELFTAYKRVVASLFSPDVISYRKNKSIERNPIAMAVGCTPMISPIASGVIYTTDPTGLRPNAMILTACWGLGKLVVEGEGETDQYVVSRDAPYSIFGQYIGRKAVQYTSGEESEIALTPVAPEKQEQPCLDASLVRKIGEGALHIEHYMKSFQDIEWSVNRDNQVIYLQARPLQFSAKVGPDKGQLLAAARNYPILLKDEGVIASRGIGAGTVFHVQSEEDGRHFPRGAVLVTRHTSPRMSKIVPLASAVVTDLGAVTGHMATICREYRVPTIVGTGKATRILEPGTDVTVDAEENVIYRGIVRELLTAQLIEKIPYEETYEFKLLRRALKRVSTLRLTDPQSSEFDAGHCRTFHDIIRFGHEMAVRKIAEGIQPSQLDAAHSATKLRLPIPLDLTVVDIGGGIKRGIPSREVSLEDIACAPLLAILRALVAPGIWQSEPVDLDLKGFMSSFTSNLSLQALSGSRVNVNLALVTGEYVNLNLALGYHFNMVDGNLSEDAEKNYAYFRFFGGVTELTRRTRRVRLLAQILEQSDFAVESKGDLIIARSKKIDRTQMEAKFRLIGQLIGYTRQLDVLLRSETDIDFFAERFLKAEGGTGGPTS